MAFLSKKAVSLLIANFLLSSNLYASQEGGEESPAAVVSPHGSVADIDIDIDIDGKKESSDSVVLPYGPAAYEAFFNGIKGIEGADEVKTVAETFLKTYADHVTMPVFYHYVLQAEKTEKISLSHIAIINDFIRNRVGRGAKPSTSLDAAKDHEFETNGVLSLTAMDIKRYLSERIIGEDRAMQSLAVVVHRHLQGQLINQMFRKTGVSAAPVKKTNVLLIGPTGSGKTASIEHLATLLNVPFFMGDASTFTRTGYMGDSVSSMIEGLLRACDYDVAKAQRGIIFIDELDKIAAKDTHGSRDVAGDDVQAELLKLIEGKDCMVKRQTFFGKDTYKVKTGRILFIGGGAFTSLPKKPGADYTFKDLVSIGMKPELVGRFGNIICFEGMTPQKLDFILRTPAVSPISEAGLLMGIGYGIHVYFDEGSLEYIAKKAYLLGTGARGLSTVVNELIEPLIVDCAKHRGYVVNINLTPKNIKEALAKLEAKPELPEHLQHIYM